MDKGQHVKRSHQKAGDLHDPLAMCAMFSLQGRQQFCPSLDHVRQLGICCSSFAVFAGLSSTWIPILFDCDRKSHQMCLQSPASLATLGALVSLVQPAFQTSPAQESLCNCLLYCIIRSLVPRVKRNTCKFYSSKCSSKIRFESKCRMRYMICSSLPQIRGSASTFVPLQEGFQTAFGRWCIRFQWALHLTYCCHILCIGAYLLIRGSRSDALPPDQNLLLKMTMRQWQAVVTGRTIHAYRHNRGQLQTYKIRAKTTCLVESWA